MGQYSVGDHVTLPAGTKVGMGRLRADVSARIDQIQTASDGTPFYGVSWTDPKTGKRRTTWWTPTPEIRERRKTMGFKYAVRSNTVRDNAGQGMHVGWMDAFIYAADLYCEDCGRAIRKDLKSKGHTNDSDSENYPQGPYSDGGGESDGPQHCGSNADCLNAMEFAGSKVGVWLGNPLTDDGVESLKEMLSNPSPTAYQLALHEFWSDVYSDYLEGWEPPVPEAPSPQLPLPGVRERSGAPKTVMYRGWRIERVQGATQIGHKLPGAGSIGQRLGFGTHRQINGWNIYYPQEYGYTEGATKWADTLKEAKEYIDNYEGPATTQESSRSPIVRDYEGMSYEQWLQAARSHHDAHVHDNTVARLAYSRGIDPHQFVEMYGGFALEESVQAAGGVNFHVNFQRGERLRIRVKGPDGQPLEAFWFTVDDTMSLNEVALRFAQTAQAGMFIEVVSGKLKWTFQVERFAGQPSVKRVRGTYTREGRS